MEIDNKQQIDGTYIFHFEGGDEHNHVLHLRNTDTFSQRCYFNSEKKKLNFMRTGKYKKIKENEIEFSVEYHQKLNEEDTSKSSKDEKFIIKINPKTGDLDNVPISTKDDLKSFLKIITLKEPEKKNNLQTLVNFFIDKMEYIEPIFIEKSTDKILYAPTKLKLINKEKCFKNLDTPLYQLFEPNSFTGVVSLSIMESATKIKSRRNFNIILNDFEKKEEKIEMPLNHNELMKEGGKCPVIHSDINIDDNQKEEMTDCPFDHTQCKQQ